MTAEDAPTAPPEEPYDNLTVAEITLRIVYDAANKDQARPEKWNFYELLDLSGNEYVETLKYEELGSYEEIIGEAVDDRR